jgi:hypothetical protein
MDIHLHVTPKPKPKDATILPYAAQKRFFKSFVNGLTGSDNYVCGNCGAILCEHIDRGPTLKIGNLKLESTTKQGIVFLCPCCDNYNALPQSTQI